MNARFEGGRPAPRRARICIVTSSPMTVRAFLTGHIGALRKDHQVNLVTNGSLSDLRGTWDDADSFFPVPIERAISIPDDIAALSRLAKLFRRQGFDCVHSYTPKAGLLAMLAAAMTGVPVRIHTFTGQVWATRRGPGRLLLKTCDRLISACATHVLCDSHSQREFLIRNGIVSRGGIGVLADGSISGVDTERFRPDAASRARLRAQRSIPDDAVVFLFLGRLCRDKGAVELLEAFSSAAKDSSRLHLLLVGPDEESLDPVIAAAARRYPGRIHRQGFTDRPQEFMAASDVFVLPSHREGFGSVVLEAGAVGLPVIASRIYGLTDAVEEGVTGILHEVGSIEALTEAIRRLAQDQDFRLRLGAAGRKRAAEMFSAARLEAALTAFYGTALRGASA